MCTRRVFLKSTGLSATIISGTSGLSSYGWAGSGKPPVMAPLPILPRPSTRVDLTGFEPAPQSLTGQYAPLTPQAHAKNVLRQGGMSAMTMRTRNRDMLNINVVLLKRCLSLSRVLVPMSQAPSQRTRRSNSHYSPSRPLHGGPNRFFLA